MCEHHSSLSNPQITFQYKLSLPGCSVTQFVRPYFFSKVPGLAILLLSLLLFLGALAFGLGALAFGVGETALLGFGRAAWSLSSSR